MMSEVRNEVNSDDGENIHRLITYILNDIESKFGSDVRSIKFYSGLYGESSIYKLVRTLNIISPIIEGSGHLHILYARAVHLICICLADGKLSEQQEDSFINVFAHDLEIYETLCKFLSDDSLRSCGNLSQVFRMFDRIKSRRFIPPQTVTSEVEVVNSSSVNQPLGQVIRGNLTERINHVSVVEDKRKWCSTCGIPKRQEPYCYSCGKRT